jgi:DNA invertase Pin-like site-specific DNA recombinase
VAIAEWHVDRDETGGSHERPGLRAAIDRAIAGETDGIVARDIDRFSRITEAGLADLRRLEEVGARLAFKAQEIDTSTPGGKMVYTIMLAVHSEALERLKAGWDTSKRRAIERGVKISRAMLGLRADSDGRLQIDPDTADHVREAFRRAAGAQPDRKVQAAMDYLKSAGIERTFTRRKRIAGTVVRNGKPYPKWEALPEPEEVTEPAVWTTTTVRRLLTKSADYTGAVTYGDYVHENAHPPLVDRPTWERAQPVAPGNTRAPARTFMLSGGLLRCAECGSHMSGSRSGQNQATYRCSNSTRPKAKRTCPAPAIVLAEVLETYVYDALLDVFQRREIGSYEPGENGLFLASDGDELADALAALEAAEDELAAWASDLEQRQLIGEQAYRAGLEARALARDDATERKTELASKRPPSYAYADEEFSEATDEQLRAMLDDVFASISVTKGRLPKPDPELLHGRVTFNLREDASDALAKHLRRTGRVVVS